MIALSQQTVVAFERRMERAGVHAQERAGYLRWVRFYLDFGQKYGHPVVAQIPPPYRLVVF